MSIVDDMFKIYFEAIDEVENLGAYFESDMKKNNVKFSKEFFCWMFEALLQHSLIEVACVDGRMDAREVVMINKASKYADIVNMSNSMLKTSLKWEDLIDADTDSVKKWLGDIKAIVLKPMQETFVSLFAMFDTIKYGDSIGKVGAGVLSLMILLMHVDGECNGEEKRALQDTYLMQTLAEIRLEMENIEKSRK